jgi:hypothetical protein
MKNEAYVKKKHSIEKKTLNFSQLVSTGVFLDQANCRLRKISNYKQFQCRIIVLPGIVCPLSGSKI